PAWPRKPSACRRARLPPCSAWAHPVRASLAARRERACERTSKHCASANADSERQRGVLVSADGFLTPGAPHAELEQRYRRLLRLYPRDFRARRTDEMIGVLMASAADGQNRPARGDVSDIVRGSLLARLRGPRGGWPFALSAFALVAPLFLVLTDILQVAFPYSESQAAVQSRISVLEAHGVPAAGILQSAPVPQQVGGLQFLSQPPFLILAAGHL